MARSHLDAIRSRAHDLSERARLIRAAAESLRGEGLVASFAVPLLLAEAAEVERLAAAVLAELDAHEGARAVEAA